MKNLGEALLYLHHRQTQASSVLKPPEQTDLFTFYHKSSLYNEIKLEARQLHLFAVYTIIWS